MRIAAVYDGAEVSRAYGNGEVPVVNVAVVAAAATTTTTIPTCRRCQGVRVDGRQRQRRAGGSGSGGQQRSPQPHRGSWTRQATERSAVLLVLFFWRPGHIGA